MSEICTAQRAIATDPSQLIPEYAQKFQHQAGFGEWPEMLSYLKSFVMQILPSVAATIIGAYIVNHYIVAKPASDSPAAAVSGAQSKAGAKADAKNSPAKPTESHGEVANLPEAGVKAKGISEKALLEKNAAAEKAVVEKPAAEKATEKVADKPAETASIPAEPRRHQTVREKAETREKPEKTAVRVIPLTPAQPATPAPIVAAPASAPAAEVAPEDRRDANDLARAAIDRLRGGDNTPRTQSAARVPETPRAPERNPEALRVPETPSPLAAQAVRPLPPPIMVSAPPTDAVDPPASLQRPPYAASARGDDPLRPTPPAEIPTARPPLDLRAEMAPPREKEKTSVADDMLSAAKSVFHSVLPK